MSVVKINRSVGRYKDKHQGERCVILCNGPSLDFFDLEQLKETVTIGLNASWMVYDATYHVATDDWQLVHYSQHRDIDSWTNLFTANVDYGEIPTPKACSRVQILDHGGEACWSWDLEEGVYLCTTILWYALQLARWMGFERCDLVGFDLCGFKGRSKFRAHPHAQDPFFEKIADTQNRLMKWASDRLEGQMEIKNLSPISACDTLPNMFHKMRANGYDVDKLLEEWS